MTLVVPPLTLTRLPARSQALITALFGVAIGAVGCYLLLRHSWWGVTGWLAIGAAALLNLITDGLHSRAEDAIKWGVTAVLFVIFIVAVRISRPQARAEPDRPATGSH